MPHHPHITSPAAEARVFMPAPAPKWERRSAEHLERASMGAPRPFVNVSLISRKSP